MQQHPDIPQLLSPAAQIQKTTKRAYFEKRIVSFEAATYVLYRFPSREKLDQLEKYLAACTANGVKLQNIVALCTSRQEYARFGYWAALDYLPGAELLRKAHPSSIHSLARNLAGLHAVSSTERRSLFHDTVPELPHHAYLADNPDLPAEHRAWIVASHDRLQALNEFQLTHGDLYGKNIIVGDDHTVALIDYELLTFDLAGIEFGSALLRPFCGTEANRIRFHNTYLKYCPHSLRTAWEALGQDFIFAAAARLALSRKQRIRNLWMQRALHTLVQKLPPRLITAFLASGEIEKSVAASRLAEKRYKHFQAFARNVAAHCAATPEMAPLPLIQAGLGQR